MTATSEAFPPGVVGIVAADTARFSMFGASLSGLQMPEGSQIKWRIGYHEMAAQTNELVQIMLAEKSARWLWIMGDDHAFAPGLLMQLLGVELHSGPPDILVPLCLTRMPPYRPVIFTGFKEDGRHRTPIDLEQFPRGGVTEIHSAGSAGMLVRRHVFEQMEPPWFQSYEISPVEMGEDVVFCDKARDHGFSLYADLDAYLGHCTTGIIWPGLTRDGWSYGFTLAGGYNFKMPPIGA